MARASSVLVSNITIQNAADIPESDKMTLTKATSTDVIAEGDILKVDGVASSMLVSLITTPAASNYGEDVIGIAMHASDGANGPQLITVATECAVMAKVKAGETTLIAGKAFGVHRSPVDTESEWQLAAFTADGIFWALETQAVSSYGKFLFSLNRLTGDITPEQREKVTTT